MSRTIFQISTLLCYLAAVKGNMEGHIVGGSFTSILRYPHSAFLKVGCVDDDLIRSNWICGSSIVNQRLLLTAAHCVFNCFIGSHIIVHFGDEVRDRGGVRYSDSFLIHESYNTRTSENDIALVRLEVPLNLDSRVSRVALMEYPPYDESAMVAGWGLVDEVNRQQGHNLKHIPQKIWPRSECLKRLGPVPRGTICASSNTKEDYAAQGDSGSALVVRGYVQVGLVSYKIPSVATDLIVYTDVPFFYHWITLNAQRLLCFDRII